MHIPVLSKEILEYLNIQPADTVLDATVGGAGHSLLLAERLGEKGILVGIDADREAVQRGRERLQEMKCKVYIEEGNFRSLDQILEKIEVQSINKALFDLGWSSFQIADADRGFSFQNDGPLAMTYQRSPNENEITAEDIVNDWSEDVLKDLISVFGEERYAGRIAAGIVETRSKERIIRTGQLVESIRQSVPVIYTRQPIHFATRTFQALRIAVNDEFGAIKEALPKVIERLSKGGRLAVITFHSGEDRIVKTLFKKYEIEGIIEKCTKKPVVPTDEEIAENRRARSAKLRIVEKK